MNKIFWENPYQHTLQTHVVEVDATTVLFADSIAYSFAGGQESDKAWVNDIPILNSLMEGNLIYYTLPENHGLKIGDQVTMTIDWQRRLRLMRLHFAAELILEIVSQNYHLEKVGAHIAESKARIDFKSDSNIFDPSLRREPHFFDTNISTHFPEILSQYNAIITADLLIEKGYSDVAAQRRYWKIEGFAQVPCGGTHVNSTAEVGYVTLKREKPGKGIERIEIRLA